MRKIVAISLALLALALSTRAQGVPAPINDALADLSQRVGQTITLDNNTLSNWRWEQAQFPDASLGCPSDGELYAQVITDGYIFELTYQGTVYEYHTSLDGNTVRLCEQVSADAPTPQPELNEQYSNELCPAPTEQSGVYIRSYLADGIVATGTLPVNRLREQPTTSSPIIAEMPQNAVFTVQGTPSCDNDGIVWWQINYDGVTGWSAEGQGTERYIVPQPPTPLPVIRANIAPENAAQLTRLSQIEGNFFPDVSWSPEGSELAIAGGTGSASLNVYTLNDMTRPQYFPQDENVSAIEFHPSGQQVVIGTLDGGIHYWNIFPDSPVTEALYQKTHGRDIADIVLSPDGSLFASAGVNALTTATDQTDFAIILEDSNSLVQIGVFVGQQAPIREMALSPNTTTLAAVDGNGTLTLWAFNSRQLITQETNIGANAIAYSPNGQFFAVGTSAGDVLLYDAASNRLLTTLSGHSATVNGVAFSPDNRLLGSVSADGTLRLWDTQSDANVATITLDNVATELAFSPDGTLIAVPNRSNAVSLYGVEQ